MPDLFGAWTRRWLFDVAPGSAMGGRTRIVSVLVDHGGRLLSADTEVTEIAFGSSFLYRLVGIALPALQMPMVVRVVPEPATTARVVAVDVLSDPGFYLFPMRSIFAWTYSRAGKHIRAVVQAETGYPLIASSEVPRTQQESPPEVVLQRFLDNVARETGADDQLQPAVAAASNSLQAQDVRQAVTLTRQIIATIRGRAREDGIRHLVERGIDRCLDRLEERDAARPPNVP